MVISHTTASVLRIGKDDNMVGKVVVAMNQLGLADVADADLPRILDEKEADLRFKLKLLKYVRTITLTPPGKREEAA
jgi:hypothetical protein